MDEKNSPSAPFVKLQPTGRALIEIDAPTASCGKALHLKFQRLNKEIMHADKPGKKTLCRKYKLKLIRLNDH